MMLPLTTLLMARVLADPLAAVAAAGSGLSRPLGGLIALGMLGAGLTQLPGALREGDALARGTAAWLVVLTMGLFWADLGFWIGLRWWLVYAAPVCLGLAATRTPVDVRIFWVVSLVGAPFVFWTLWSAVSGRALLSVVNGIPRAIGPYANPHACATAMTALFLVNWILHESGRDRWARGWGALMCAAAALALCVTWVRTTMIFVWVFLSVYLVVRRRWRALGVVVLMTSVALLGSDAMRDRFSDLGAVATLDAPEGGWAKFGSSRGDIWLGVVGGLVEQGPVTWILGLGLGHHRSLYRGLDPHSEVLSLWVQLGAIGVGVYVSLLLTVARRLVHALAAPTVLTSSGLSVVAALWVTAPVSNDFLARATLAAVCWAVLGLAYGASSDGEVHQPRAR